MSHAQNQSVSERADNADTHGENHGHTTFHVTYDDTGAVVDVVAPNGWRMREVIAEGYRLLGETARPGDRVEANGTDLAQYLDLHVKEFVERRIAPKGDINIVSNTGGARPALSVA
jgi:hypothetical protein